MDTEGGGGGERKFPYVTRNQLVYLAYYSMKKKVMPGVIVKKKKMEKGRLRKD